MFSIKADALFAILDKVAPHRIDWWGAVWRVTARPAPGEEPFVVSADRFRVVLPLGVVLKVGGPLLRLPL